MGKLPVAYNKTLKLVNALCLEISEDDFEDLNKVLYQMQNYIRAKGATPMGPLVQCTNLYLNDKGDADLAMTFIQQTSNFILHPEKPYTSQSVLRVPGCLFVRFAGEQDQLKFAYDKLNLISFEEDIPLTGRTFTVYTSQGGDLFTADVFMEKEAGH